MEGVGKREIPARKGLRRLRIYYGSAALVLLLTISGIMILNGYRDVLYDSVSRLLALKVGYVKMKDGTGEIRRSMAAVKGIVPSDLFDDPPDRRLLASLDMVKARFRHDEVTIAEILYRETEVGLPVSIKGRMADYSVFVNDIGFLQTMQFPFFAVMNVSMRRNEESGMQVVIYEITGELRLPRSQTPGGKGGAPS